MKNNRLFIFLVIIMCSCGGRSGSLQGSASERRDVKYYTYEVVNVYPHSTDSYTQGLFWHDGFLYESIGQYGESALLKVDLDTGQEVMRHDMDERYFGEGAAFFHGRIYQLTWMEHKAFVYDAESFEQVAEIYCPGEGWGLTTDGRDKLYMSNGTYRLYYTDGEKLSGMKYVDVTLNGNRVRYLNELEWIDGEVWANVYMSDVIVRIDPATGYVTGVIDLTGILPESERTPRTDVLNGIAYDQATGRFFVTGKNWSKLYEIKLIEKTK